MQVILNGLVTGLGLALLAAAFAVVYLPTRVFHIGLAGIYAAVPYVALTATQKGASVPAAILLAIGAGVILSLLCDLLNHRRLTRTGASAGAHLIASLGIFIVLVQVVALSFGNESQVLRTGIDTTATIAGAVLTRTQIVSAVVGAVCLGAYLTWLHFTGIGLQLRALADNPTEVALRGYNVRHLHLLAFGISGLLGSVAALLAAYDVGFEPNGGLPVLLLAIVAVIIGGRKSFLGPLLGGILLGLVRNLVVWHWSAKWQEAVTFVLLALALLFVPNGILGRKARLEVNAS